ncbi:MAG TPA: sulfite exporter TauE/SafE family protein [Crenotrichaceae bacterium]|nr:sulfite exporter TauE/SafE family protein [Crenotrichaceae bacterium]
MSVIIVDMLAFGAVAGLLSGLFGIGGGIVLVPFMIWLFGRADFPVESIVHMAIATSLATIIPTSFSSVLAHQRIGTLQWSAVAMIAPYMFIGAIMGSVIAAHLSGHLLKTVFAAYLIIVSLRMWLQNISSVSKTNASHLVMATAGAMIGTLSSLLGIGGGTLSVPFLTFYGYPMRNAVAISAACGIPIAVAGSLGYAFLNKHHSSLPVYSLGYIYLPAFLATIITSVCFAPLGAVMAKRLPVQPFKRLFAVIVFAVGIKLLW